VTLEDDASTGEQSPRTDDRAWTAAEKHKVRGLAKNNTSGLLFGRSLADAVFGAQGQIIPDTAPLRRSIANV
jgi:hypothetical protein